MNYPKLLPYSQTETTKFPQRIDKSMYELGSQDSLLFCETASFGLFDGLNHCTFPFLGFCVYLLFIGE